MIREFGCLVLAGVAVAAVAIVVTGSRDPNRAFSERLAAACRRGHTFRFPVHDISWDSCRVIDPHSGGPDDSTCILEFQKNGDVVLTLAVARDVADFQGCGAHTSWIPRRHAMFQGVADRSGWMRVEWVGGKRQ